MNLAQELRERTAAAKTASCMHVQAFYDKIEQFCRDAASVGEEDIIFTLKSVYASAFPEDEESILCEELPAWADDALNQALFLLREQGLDTSYGANHYRVSWEQ